jgi:hypothetical protein
MTLRPSYLVEDAKEWVAKNGRHAIVTSSDGRLMGIFRHDVRSAPLGAHSV